MIAHETARRGQVLYGRTTADQPVRKRLSGRRTNERDDKGRETMPFDLFLTGPGDLVELMTDVFGGKALRDAAL